jgi:uncharacterized protein
MLKTQGATSMRKTLLVLGFSFLICALTHAASFDCTKARTAQEKAICGTPALSAADDQMAAAYKAWLAAAQPDWADGIRGNQLVWLRMRDEDCSAGDAIDPVAACLGNVYKERIAELQGMVQHIGGVTFVSQAITLTARDTPNSVPAGMSEITPGFGTLAAAWPQASSTTPQWTAWNKAIDEAAMQAVDLFNGNSQKAAQDWSKLVLPGIDDVVRVTVDGFNGKMISATIENDYDGHGAHPTENSSEFYWMLGEQRALKPEDVFVPASGWDTWMAQHLDNYLKQVLDSNGNDQRQYKPSDLPGIVTNPADWKLEPAGFSIFFQPYQVACYACTPDPMTIPWSDLKPYLQPSFVLPQ